VKRTLLKEGESRGRELRKDEDKDGMALNSCPWMAHAQGLRYRGGIAGVGSSLLR
jgi:hypothetical protein